MSEKRSYRAYLLSGSDNIRAVIVLEAGDDASACLEAGIRLRESDCAAIEVCCPSLVEVACPMQRKDCGSMENAILIENAGLDGVSRCG